MIVSGTGLLALSPDLGPIVSFHGLSLIEFSQQGHGQRSGVGPIHSLPWRLLDDSHASGRSDMKTCDVNF